MIISRTPVRINFFGGGTDFPEYYERCGGAVFGTAIDKHVYVSINRLSDFFEYKIRVGYSKSELVDDVRDIQHPSVRECLKYKDVTGNLDIHIFADLPAKTGLGSSSAFTVGFLNALHALEGKRVSKRDLSEQAHTIERDIIKEHVGCQDQIHAAYGGLNVVEFGKDGFKVRPVVIKQENKEYLEECMLVFYTGITRFSTDVQKHLVDETRKMNNDEFLQRMTDMVYEAERIVSSNEKNDMLLKFGALLHEGWELKKRCSARASNETIDDIYSRAMNAGAYGGKISGAGGGGFMTLFVPPENQAAVRSALKDLSEVQVGFENEGSSIIYMR
jgi:D-glycero-alpha-D-manno-heptose-7-phosphate kinase